MSTQAGNDRLYYLDGLRVFAVLLLIPSHTGMIFVHWDFPIENNVTSDGLTILNAFIANWHMPLFFLVSGASSYLALKKRNANVYVKERFCGFLFLSYSE
jgi:fucose 4-O-acetylase-like acetyltransferase